MRVWSPLVAAILVLGGTLMLVHSSLMERAHERAREQSNAEARFIEHLVRELLEDGNYEAIQDLLSSWGRDNPATVELRIRARNGFDLARFQRATSTADPLRVERVISYGYGNAVTLIIERDVGAFATEAYWSTAFLAGIMSLGVFAVSLLLARSIRRQREAERYQILSERLYRTNQQLEHEISARRATELALAEEKESAELTLRSIGDGVITTDRVGLITRINPIAAALTGWDEEEARQRPIDEVYRVHAANGVPLPAISRPAGRDSSTADEGQFLLTRDAEQVQIAGSSAPIHGVDGHYDGTIIVFHNVTEEARVRRALVESETRFRRLVENLQEHFLYSVDHNGRIAYVSPSITRILGFTQAEFCRRFDTYLTDNPINAGIAKLMQRCLKGESIPAFEAEIESAGNEPRLIEVRAMPVLDEQGLVVSVEGIAHDITEQRAVQRELMLAASVFENGAEGILVMDLKGHIQRVNLACMRITGHTEEKLLRMSLSLLSAPREDLETIRATLDNLHGDARWQGELWLRHADGHDYPVRLSLTRIPPPDTGGPQEERTVAIFSDISDQKAAEAEIARLAFHDPLTDLPNRSLLIDRLDTNLARAQRDGHIDAVMFLDLDHFKHVNDSLGHTVGDSILKEVAARLGSCVRSYDTVARLGGDEFVVLFNSIAHERRMAVQTAGRLAEKIRSVLSRPMLVDGHELHSSPSIGVALLPLDASLAEDALKHADKAMYQAKARGRNCVQFFTPEMQYEAEQRLVLESELRRALEQDELRLHYQPIVDAACGRMVGAEALLRWQHRERGLLMPQSFITIAEESGLILPIGRFVLRAACEQIRSWRGAGLPIDFVSVNLSAVQFRQADLTEQIAGTLRESDLDAAQLELELTESLLVENVEAVIRILGELAAMGISLSIDDFGTGYSSLSYLKRFSVHKVKIDRTFVEDLPGDPEARSIAVTIVQMAKNLDLDTVAEGVERQDQLEFLRGIGCNYIQGYLCARPMPADALDGLLRSGGTHNCSPAVATRSDSDSDHTKTGPSISAQ